MNAEKRSETVPAGSQRPSTRTVVAAAIVAVVVVLLVQNRDPVTVELLVVDVTGPVWLVGLSMFLLGALSAWLLLGWRARRAGRS